MLVFVNLCCCSFFNSIFRIQNEMSKPWNVPIALESRKTEYDSSKSKYATIETEENDCKQNDLGNCDLSRKHTT